MPRPLSFTNGETIMPFHMNSGYSGWSMSLNAVAAYEDGEKPKSKWTKKAMLEALAAYAHEYDLLYIEDLSKLKKAELFERFFTLTSWHHTGKYCNETDFYGIDEDAVAEVSREMSAEEIGRRDSEAERAAEEAERQRLAELAEWQTAKAMQTESAKAYEAAHGFSPYCVLAYMKAHPERCEVRQSKKSKRECVYYSDPRGGSHACLVKDAAAQNVTWFSAI